MTDATTRLAAISVRAEAATEGPWHDAHEEFGCVHLGDYGWVASGPRGQGPEYDVDSEQGKADAEFIAHARTDVPALVAALQAVLELTPHRYPDADDPARELGEPVLFRGEVRRVIEEALNGE